jgi:hypothetical protein
VIQSKKSIHEKPKPAPIKSFHPVKMVPEGEHMLNLSNVVSQLQAQRKKVQSELSRLDAAISALRGTDTSDGSGTIRVASSRPSRTLSAAGRRAISLAQKARWAKRVANMKAGTTEPKRTMSAGARRKIAAAQRARWAAWKAKQKKAA